MDEKDYEEIEDEFGSLRRVRRAFDSIDSGIFVRRRLEQTHRYEKSFVRFIEKRAAKYSMVSEWIGLDSHKRERRKLRIRSDCIYAAAIRGG